MNSYAPLLWTQTGRFSTNPHSFRTLVIYLSDIGAPINIYLVNGRIVKCVSNEKPIVIDVNKAIAEFRGNEDLPQLFKDRIYNAAIELLNSLKEINYPVME